VLNTKPCFDRYIGVDYSGAETASSSLKGLRVYMGSRRTPATEVHPPPSPRRYWTREGIAEWLVDELREKAPTIVGIDHAFSFPIQYFERYGIPKDWTAFLEDFQEHWPTDKPHTYVDFLRPRNKRSGNSRWRRLAETSCRAKSVFHFDVQGSVAKSTHSGIPWLHYIRRNVGDRVHFWPFDGWSVPPVTSVVAEIYPALWNRQFPREDRDPHQHDAYCVAETLRQADFDGSIRTLFKPALNEQQLRIASFEGWILGLTEVVGPSYGPATGCPFCERAETKVVIARNELAVAFPDAFPLSKGHTLIVPLRHEADCLRLSADEQQALLSLTRSVRRRLDRKHSPDGYNIGMNVGHAGGQTIDHVHLHVIPRYAGDVPDPRGGIRWVLPAKARYWSVD
jgi:diadenosine tetraphosphate (Ap4A) HIT family hydrolase